MYTYLYIHIYIYIDIQYMYVYIHNQYVFMYVCNNNCIDKIYIIDKARVVIVIIGVEDATAPIAAGLAMPTPARKRKAVRQTNAQQPYWQRGLGCPPCGVHRIFINIIFGIYTLLYHLFQCTRRHAVGCHRDKARGQ